jgi:hypothetical protein
MKPRRLQLGHERAVVARSIENAQEPIRVLAAHDADRQRQLQQRGIQARQRDGQVDTFCFVQRLPRDDFTNSFQDASRSSLFPPIIVLLFSSVSLECELLETAASSNYKLLHDPAVFRIEASTTLFISTAVSKLRHSYTAGATFRIPNGSHWSPTDCNRA